MLIKSNHNYDINIREYIPQNMKEIIIACHGFGGDKESSAIIALANEMKKYSIGVICFDFPAHGESNASDNDLKIQNCIDDIFSVEKYIENKYLNIPISIFATSFGAYITLLKIFKYNTKYNHIILRAPAIKMDEILKKNILKENFGLLKEKGEIYFGFERKFKLTYSFYISLTENKILNLYNNVEKQKINIIQGNVDDIAPIKDTYEFRSLDTENIFIKEILGADHRMKKEGELEQVIEFSKKILL